VTDILVMDREQAIALMEWPFLETLAPELRVYRDRLQGAASELIKSTHSNAKCPPCISKKYKTWERGWLTKLHILVNRDANLKIVVSQFLMAPGEETALLQHVQAALGTTQTTAGR